jgi:hypothetical protein
MYPRAPVSRQRAAHEPLYDIDPRTGVSIEVFYADRALETFGRSGAGWFWCSRRRLLAGRIGEWAFPYELRSVSTRDD